MSYFKYLRMPWLAGLTVLLLLSGCTALFKGNQQLDRANYAQAIPLYQEYLASHPDSVEARRNMGLAYLRSGQTDDAMVALKAAVAKDPKDQLASKVFDHPLTRELVLFAFSDSALALRQSAGTA